MGGWEVRADWQKQPGTVPLAEDLLCDSHQHGKEDSSFPVTPSLSTREGWPLSKRHLSLYSGCLQSAVSAQRKERLILSGGMRDRLKKAVTYEFGLEDLCLDFSGKGGQDKQRVWVPCWAQGLQRLPRPSTIWKSQQAGTASGFLASPRHWTACAENIVLRWHLMEVSSCFLILWMLQIS